MLPFWISIALLSLVQGVLVALPRPRRAGRLCATAQPALGADPAAVGDRLRVRSRGAAESASAEGLTYLALVAVPPLAALALGWLDAGARGRGARCSSLALFALAWADRGGLAGRRRRWRSRRSAASRSASLLARGHAAALAGGRDRRDGAADTALVVSDLLQRPQQRAQRRPSGRRSAAAAERVVRLGGDGLRRPVRRGVLGACWPSPSAAPQQLRGAVLAARWRSPSTCCSSSSTSCRRPCRSRSR